MMVISAIYGIAQDRTAVAALAGVVTLAAEDGDATAAAILKRAAAELAAMIDAAAGRAELDLGPLPLAVAGGMLLNCDRLLESLPRELTSVGRTAQLTRVEEPVRGAVILAQREAA
jgi:N-acetylglucosamine kinase-like BadF-type ATPase